MKNSNDTIGNRTRDLTASSTMPQPAAPPSYPLCFQIQFHNSTLHAEENHELSQSRQIVIGPNFGLVRSELSPL